ncbi:hypothetical protein AGABI1DRAFT_121205 [Agaricus bisporus var. burnettii JB137-S8]|uniref:SUN domain-containing protein n=1 Tax=Agaricus bisporus var. burnettii (strain JB137-S8 / ATCC MYA-4627 / FGSC 10392) TaxID=597362 RepID=K5VWD7_AGABU|nr:uncharacterized protein AGABI1DRAFT_121205 [Agaricus bisporus var. burnettii JB137-S8]EKM78789.1 hypothetical protein AGABI1DRAFT_121205 [Agaricus bisporus var. burnettii JB137-S8]
MSFAGTPLGQGRRLDHSTFLGKHTQPARPTSPARIVPTSYSYTGNSASTLESRSPPRRRPASPPHTSQALTDDSGSSSALAKFARIKQREALTSRPGGPKIISAPPKPNNWTVNDTSVILASALHIAAESDMLPAPNPNTAWASGVTRPNPAVPRSTSVEYEKDTQISTSRRLAPPPPRLSRPPVSRKPVSKNASVRIVPDSEGEEDAPANTRGKSPFEHVMDVAKKALGPATYYVRQLSHDPEDRSHSTNGNNSHNRDTSYDYAAEEQEFQEAQQAKLASHKRGPIAIGNRAYRPAPSDEESDDDNFSDDDKRRRRRRRKKTEPLGGPLTTLPVLSAHRKKKRKSKGTKNDFDDQDEDDRDSDEPNDELESAQAQQRALPIHPPTYNSSLDDPSLESTEQGLDSIPEVPEEVLPDSSPTYNQKSERSQTRRLPRSSSRTRTSAPPTRFSIGGLLGRLVNAFFRGLLFVIRFMIYLITSIFFICGRMFGTLYDVVFNRPVLWLRSTNWSSAARLAKYLTFGALLLGVWYSYQQMDIQSLIPSLFSLPFSQPSAQPIYTAPDIPAADLTEIARRLQKIELAVSDLSRESKQTRGKTEDGIRSHSELLDRLGSLESRLTEESRRLGESESKVKDALGLETSVDTVKRDVEILQAQLIAQAKRQTEKERSQVDHISDAEARAKLRALEERVGTVEGDVKEAVELGKKASTISKSVTLKVPGGQDLNKMVREAAISAISMDLIGKADYAMHAGGARVIPSLTSTSYEIRQDTLGSQFFGFLKGNGYAVGRPPVTALHHETHSGYCWPFAGQRGQLGVHLAAPVVIDEVTIDHISKDIALDIRSAPRHMEVWGLVEGGENLEKHDELVKEREQRRQQEGMEEDEEYPDTLPRNPPYIRIANFTYDVDSGSHVQTFPVLEEIKEKQMDFGIVALRVLSNWGREEFTCLYRFRVHGTRLGGMPIPDAVEDLGL